MVLALDVGNTNITVGIFRAKRLIAHGRILTHSAHPAQDYAKALGRVLAGHRIPREAVEGVIVSSVVPKATRPLQAALKRLKYPKPFVLGENIKAPIVNRYRIPSQVGQDRLVNAVATYSLYGGPAIVVDFGTAVTFDLVSRKGDYLGGLIVPGLEISLEALTRRAALLPEIKLVPPKELLGRTTVDSMQSGIFYGYGALCDGVVSRLKAHYAPRARVIATGGYAPWIVPYCQSIQRVNPSLTLQGLELIYRKIS